MDASTDCTGDCAAPVSYTHLDVYKRQMQVGRVEVKDEWKGDTTLDYAKRYTYRFPGEAEAKGLPAEEKSGGWGK